MFVDDAQDMRPRGDAREQITGQVRKAKRGHELAGERARQEKESDRGDAPETPLVPMHHARRVERKGSKGEQQGRVRKPWIRLSGHRGGQVATSAGAGEALSSSSPAATSARRMRAGPTN